MNTSRLAIFDLDGTLHCTEKALLPAIRRAMQDLGFPPAPDHRINSLYGEPLEVFCLELMGSEKYYSEFRSGIRKHQRETLPVLGELYPGTLCMLKEAGNSGWTLSICSNAGLDYIELVTEALNIRGLFAELSGRDGGASKSARVSALHLAAGSPDAAVMVGDRYHDIDAARESGILSIGCAYGYGSPEETDRADYLALTPSDITGILRSIH